MKASLTIPGRFPSLNEYIAAERTFRMKVAAMKRKYTDLVAEAAIARDMPTFNQPVFVVVDWFEKDHRRDPDNIEFSIKFILDGLVRAGVLANDTQRHILGIEHRVFVDKTRPRVTVTLHIPEE